MCLARSVAKTMELFEENITEHDSKCLKGSNFSIPKGMIPTYEPTPDPLRYNPNLISMSKPLDITTSSLVLEG